MIDAVRKVIAAYHDAPQAECHECGHDVCDAIFINGGIHGTPALDEAIEELEEILKVVERTDNAPG
jgi:ArsR family metal-binding transcriptional regulator